MFEGFSIGDLLRVVWLDSGMALHGWKSVPELREETGTAETMLAETVGHYLGFGGREDLILLAQTKDVKNDAYLNAQVIYLPCVRAVTRLETA